MKKIAILIMALSMFAVFSAAQEAIIGNVVIVASLLYKEENLSFEGVELLEGEPPDYLLQPEDGYQAELLDFEGNELFYYKFPVSLQVYDLAAPLPEKHIGLIFPYVRSVKDMNVYDQSNNLLLNVDLSEYAICNLNGKCEPMVGEDIDVCPEDCEIIPEEEIPLEEELPVEEEVEEKELPAWLVVLVVAAILLIVILLIRLKKRR